jgi:hypothetical protein
MASNLKALHIHFLFVTVKSSMKSSKIEEKERIIELIIIENHSCDTRMGRRSDEPYC